MAPSLPDGPNGDKSKCRTNRGCDKISTLGQWFERTGGLWAEGYPAIADRDNSDTSQTRQRYDEANAEGPSRQRADARSLRERPRPDANVRWDYLSGVRDTKTGGFGGATASFKTLNTRWSSGDDA